MSFATTSSSLPWTALAGRFNVANAFASSSRVQLRSFQTTSSARQQAGQSRQPTSDPSSSSSSSSSSLNQLGDLVKKSTAGSPRLGQGSQGVGGRSGDARGGFQRPGATGAAGAVYTPGAPKPTGAFFKRGPAEGRPEIGQHLKPHSHSYQALTRRTSFRALPRLGPKRRVAETLDQFHKLGLNPGKPSLHDDSYKNGNLLSPYVSEMGKILSRNKTNLTWKSQRAVGKAIRRARSMGLIPVLARSNAWRA